MEPGSATNSEIPAPPESDNRPPEKSTDDDSTGIGRSYECGFCKRGFTNAQALGGHMNIHRKDKAKVKAKQKITNREEYNSSINSNDKHEDFRHSSPISSTGHRQEQQTRYYYSHGGGQPMNYHVYLPSPNPNSQVGDFGLPVRRLGLVDPNLSLRVGQSEDGDTGDVESVNVKENEVDLELRLGHRS